MTRSKLREHIFKTLFQTEFYSQEEMSEQIALYLESEEEISEENKAYIVQKAEAILQQISEIDEQIDSKSSGWKTNRMGKTELAILRLAVYEILHDEQIPTGVAIDEAVELAKAFGGEHSAAFVNGVLAKFA